MESQQPIYKHRVDIQTRFNDYDLHGHINNNLFLSYFDIGKIAYFDTVWHNGGVDKTLSLVIAKIETTFTAPIIYNEKIAVETTANLIGEKSFTLFQQIINTQTGEIKGYGKTIMVGYHPQTRTSIAIPPHYITAIAHYENRPLTPKE